LIFVLILTHGVPLGQKANLVFTYSASDLVCQSVFSIEKKNIFLVEKHTRLDIDFAVVFFDALAL
jgi:hypothetical protein